MIPLSAQISNLQLVLERASRQNLKRGSFCMRDSEADLIRSRLEAALETLKQVSQGASDEQSQ